jgi:tetratricopeptide (TPR) repeat protein
MKLYEIIGIDANATADEIQTKYFQLAKQWHPDRLAAELADLRPTVAKIFARMNEAFHTLSDSERRERYDTLVNAGGGTARDRDLVEKAVDSALLFQKAEVLAKRHHYDKAEHLLRQAVDADPEPPEYRALLAWTIAQQKSTPPTPPEGEVSSHYQNELRILDDILRKDRHLERALFYRAELLKRSGDYEQAIRDYRKAVRLNPRNIDAAREVRLYDLRQRNASAGLLGKLFGGNKPKK